MLMLHSYTLIHIFRLKKRLSINHFGMEKILVKVLQKQKLLRLKNLIISQKNCLCPKNCPKSFQITLCRPACCYFKSDNLQYNTMERWINRTIVPPSDGPRFILIDWE